jgi:hypothetical protein
MIGTLLLFEVSANRIARAQNSPGYALSFNGTNAYVSVPSGEALNPGTNSFTVESWVKTADTADTQMVLSKYECGGNCPAGANSLYGLFVHAGGTIGAGLRSSSGGTIQFLYGSRLVTDGAWHHLVMVRDQAAGQLLLYVDGALDNSAALLSSASGSIQNDDGESDPVTIGAQAATGGPGVQNYFKGSIDEVRVWWVARSQGDIQTNMNRALPPQPNLMGYWQFNEGGGTSASDSGGHGNTGNLVGGPVWITSAVPFVPSVITQPVTGLTPTAATLNGTVNPDGLATLASFQWGLTTGYGNTTPTINLGNGATSLLLQSGLTGLAPATTYHYRAVASNGAGTATAADQTFTTSSLGSNSWTAPFSGRWEAGTNWSAGVPSSSQPLVQITNSGTKTITFDSVSGNTFPDSATITNLLIEAPGGSLNTLLVANSGPSNSLHVVASLAVLSGGAVNVTNATLTVDNGIRPVTTPNGCDVQLDGTVVVNYGTLNFSNALYTTVGRNFGGAGSFSMTNSALNVYYLIIGGFSEASAALVNSVVQLGLGLTVGHDAGFTGTLSVVGGQFTATNTIFSPDDTVVTVGSRGAGNATFANANVQFGNTVVGSIGGSAGSITLQSGTLTMRKTFLGESVEQPNPYPVTGSLSQLGGTLTTSELHVGVNSNCVGTVNLSGGTLQAANVTLGETNGATGLLNMNGGTSAVSSNLLVGSFFSEPCSVNLNGGLLTITNATQSGLLNLADGIFVLQGGAASVDNLVATNPAGQLVFNSGTLETRGCTISNGSQFVVGDGASLATLRLSGGTNLFADGLSISAGSTVYTTGTVVNGGVLNNGTFFINGPGVLTFLGPVTNTHTILASGAATFIDFYGPVQNSGSIVATNGAVIAYHSQPASVLTQPPGLIGLDSALLQGSVNPNGLPATAWFQWGTGTNYDHASPPTRLPSGGGTVAISASLSGLSPASIYHYRAVATNIFGTSFGVGLSFQTTSTNARNLALSRIATESSTAYNGEAWRAVDGNTNGAFPVGSVAQTAGAENPLWWQVDLGTMQAIGGVSVWFRTDGVAGTADNFVLLIKDSLTNTVLTRQYAGRPPAFVAWNFPQPVLGQCVQVESFSGTNGPLGLAEVQVFSPVQPGSVSFSQDLATNLTLEVNHNAMLGPVALNADPVLVNQITYQWQLGGVDVAGATDSAYTMPLASFAANGQQYRCQVSVPGLQTNSLVATIAVIPDTTPPLLWYVTFTNVAGSDSLGNPTLQATLHFTERMDPATLADLSNYSFLGGTLIGAAAGPDGQSVILSIAGVASPFNPYSVSVNNLRDLAGNLILTTTTSDLIPFYSVNHALTGTASQSSTAPGTSPQVAIDGNTDGNFADGSVTESAGGNTNGWWEVDLGTNKAIGQLHIWFRTDCCNGLPGTLGPSRDDDFTLKILDANRVSVWATTYPGTPPTDVFFNFATEVQGRFVRFESQNPPSTSDGVFSLAEVQVFAPYAGAHVYEEIARSSVSPTNPTIYAHENQSVRIGPIDAVTDAAPIDQVAFQWKRNGLDIPGATGNSYLIQVVSLTNNGDIYSCRLTLPGTYTDGVNFTLAVTNDETAPVLTSVDFDELGGQGPLRATVKFSQRMAAMGLTNLGSYHFVGGTIVGGITPGAGNNSATFNFLPATNLDGTFSLSVDGLTSLAGNPLGAVGSISGVLPFTMTNMALSGFAAQSSIGLGAGPQLAIDGNVDGDFSHGSVTANATTEVGAWWEVNLLEQKFIGRVHVWFRTDCCTNRQDNFILKILDNARHITWQEIYPGRPPTDIAFNIAPAVFGQYVRVEAPIPEIDGGAFSLAEVQVFAPYQTNRTLAAIPKPVVTQTGTNLVISWGGSGTLQLAPSPLGPWLSISNAAAPWIIPSCLVCTEQFFRVTFPLAQIAQPAAVRAITLDSFDPQEAWPDRTVTAQFTLYKDPFHAAKGFVTGYITQSVGYPHILDTAWQDTGFIDLEGFIPPYSGSLQLNSWNLLFLAPFATDPGPGGILPIPVFNDPTLDGDPSLFPNPIQRPPGQYYLVVEYWQEDPNGTDSFNGIKYRMESSDSKPIDIYPPCDGSKFSDFVRIGPVSADQSLKLYPVGSVAGSQTIMASWKIVSPNFPPFKTHLGSVSDVSFCSDGIFGRCEDDGKRLARTEQLYFSDNLFDSREPINSYTLTVTGNCGQQVFSGTLPIVYVKPPPPLPPQVTFTITPSDGGAPDGYIDSGNVAVLHWTIDQCPTCQIGLKGVDVSTGRIVLNQPSGLGFVGNLSVRPQYWTKYTLTATSFGNSQQTSTPVTRSCGVYNPPAAPPNPFFFRMSNPTSFSLPCFGICVFANDETAANAIAVNAYPGYTATSIAENEFVAGNYCP